MLITWGLPTNVLERLELETALKGAFTEKRTRMRHEYQRKLNLK